jgi:hypothetical protein
VAARLSQVQKTLIEKARNVGNSDMAVPLADEVCNYLCATVVQDLNIQRLFPELATSLPDYFKGGPISSQILPGHDFEALVTKLFSVGEDLDNYFSCLATLHKARLKYEQILMRQALPSFDQVGPRGLLQYGSISPKGITGLIFWRKWLYDLDNRAAQETGYLFEPILANSIGGTPVSATRSPVKRQKDNHKGRQVDCIKGRQAYEFKMRVTIAASGQGRWGEELQFPADCKGSGYTPILVVLDPTPNPKLVDLTEAFIGNGGEVFVGEEAWRHLEGQAGSTMSIFLEKYVRTPLVALSRVAAGNSPPFSVRHVDGGKIELAVGEEKLVIERSTDNIEGDPAEFPEDVSE